MQPQDPLGLLRPLGKLGLMVLLSVSLGASLGGANAGLGGEKSSKKAFLSHSGVFNDIE